jgi:hypothetical protein
MTPPIMAPLLMEEDVVETGRDVLSEEGVDVEEEEGEAGDEVALTRQRISLDSWTKNGKLSVT